MPLPFLPRRAALAVCATVVAGLTLASPGQAAARSADIEAKPPPISFATAHLAALGAQFPGAMAVADFTGDGKPDVAVATASVAQQAGVVVIQGNGRGGFTKRIGTTLPGTVGGCDLSAGDLDGDGNIDLAVSTCAAGASPVLLMLGNGHGTFTAAQSLDVGFSLSHPAIGLFNNDAKPDLAVVRETGGLSVYFGKGNGKVGAPTDYSAMSSTSVQAIDVTGDGLVDLSFTGPATMVNQGNGVFGSPVGPDFFATGSALADLDGDGILDGAGVDGTGRHVYVGHGTGDGRYHLVQTVSLNVQQTTSIAGGDFNGDGNSDLVVNGDGQVVYLLAGRGDGTVKRPVGYATGAQGLTGADLGGSKATDLISFTADPGTLYAALGSERGLAAATLVSSKVPGEVALGDVDGDGDLDAVTAGGILPRSGDIESALGTHLNQGKGRFGKTIVTTLRTETAGSGVAALVLVDVNGDHHLDAVGGFENFQFDPHNVFVALGKGNGRFSAPLLTDTGDQGVDILDLAVADVTGDALPDIVTNTRGAISVLPGNGDGTFKAPILSGDGGDQQTRTLLGDVTGDGKTDLVATIVTGNSDFASSDLVVERGDGTGRFTPVQTIPVDSNILGAELTDLSGDGRPDLAVDGRGGTNGGKGGLFVLLDSKSGSLTAPTYYPSGGGSLEAADYNGDGLIDLATDGPLGNGTAIDLNSGKGVFQIGPWIVTDDGPAAVGDVTGSPAPDIVSYPSAAGAAFGLTVNLRR